MALKYDELLVLKEKLDGIVFDIEYSDEAMKSLENSAHSINVNRWMIVAHHRLICFTVIFVLEYRSTIRKSSSKHETNQSPPTAADTAAIIREKRGILHLIEELILHPNFLLRSFIHL